MFVITGMHRSGTSVVARMFLEVGADLGDPATFYPADRWNSDGYYEQRRIHAINMPLIHGRLGRLAYFRLPSPATILKRGARLDAAIRRTAAEFDGAVVKDPRFCLTIPAWTAHGANIRGVLVCLRRPDAVARSIRRRNRLPLGLAYRLWLSHLLRLEDGIAGMPAWYVRYERLLDPATFEAEAEPAIRSFGIDVSKSALGGLYDAVIRTGMNHHPDERADLPGEVARVWSRLEDRHANQFERIGIGVSEAGRR